MQVKIGEIVNSRFYGLTIERNVHRFIVNSHGWDGRDGLVASLSPQEAELLVEYLTDELTLDRRGPTAWARRLHG